MLNWPAVTTLEAERARLERRICWALRRKDADRAERLEQQLAAVESRLAKRPRHRRRAVGLA